MIVPGRDQALCGVCCEWFGIDGPLGLVPHVLRAHPSSETARVIRSLLEGR